MSNKRKSTVAIRFFAILLAIAGIFMFMTDTYALETKADITFTAGDLKLIEAPNINFGSQQITSTNTYIAASPTTNIKVGDYRGGLEGWKLNATLSGFTKGGASSLAGAYISFTGTASGNGTLPTVGDNGTVTLSSASAAVLSAASGTGAGDFELAMSNVKLIAQNATETIGAHTATITWTLVNAG